MAILILLWCIATTTAQPVIQSLKNVDKPTISAAEYVMKAERDIQYFIVPQTKSTSRLPDMAIALIERGAHLHVPVEFGKYRQFSSANYILKHQQTKIVYFNIPVFIPSDPTSDPFEPFAARQNLMWINKYRDIVFHMLDAKYPWEGMQKIRQDYRCAIPFKVVFLLYNDRISNRMYFNSLQLHCPHKSGVDCQRMEFLEFRDDRWNYKELEERLRKIRNKMHGLPVIYDEFRDHELDYALFNATRHGYLGNPSMRRLYQAKSFGSRVPSWDLAVVLNITLIDIYDRDHYYPEQTMNAYRIQEIKCRNGFIEYTGTDMLYLDRQHRAPWVYLIGSTEHLLMFGAEGKSFSPLNFNSILGPFQWYLWLMLVILIGLSSLPAILRSKPRDVVGTVISISAPLVGQFTERGIGRKTLLWHSSWILLTLYINSCYLGDLSSAVIVPEVRHINMSFRSLVEKQFSFFAPPYSRYELQWRFRNGNHVHRNIRVHFTEEAIKEYVLLASMVNSKNLEKMSPEDVRRFLKFEKTVWFDEQKDIEAVATIGRDMLGYDYEILRQKWLASPLYMAFDINQGDIVARGYMYLLEAGFVNFWEEFTQHVLRDIKLRYYSQISGASRSANTDKGVPPVLLEDSLMLEALCLFGFGVATCILVETVSGIWLGLAKFFKKSSKYAYKIAGRRHLKRAIATDS